MKDRRRLAGWSAAVLGGVAIFAFLRFGPIPSVPQETTPTIVDRHGVVLYEPLSGKGTRRMWIQRVPPYVEQATIAAEDQRFYSHCGIDVVAVVRAMIHDVIRRRVAEGGSTITQQVAKMLLGNPPRSFLNKGREAVLAVQLETRYSKREILAMYVNLAPYGEETIGIARGARRWFGCAPEDLTAAQAAFLAALPARPSSNVRALYWHTAILKLMPLTPRQLEAALAERLSLDHGSHPLLAPHFVARVRALGLRVPRIQTTLDASLQRDVLGIIAAEKRNLLKHGAHSVAVAVLDNRTGEWLAYEGSGDYFGETFGGAIDGVTTLRQPGSTLKPFTYALGFESGFTPATVLDDVPAHFATAEEGVVYTPRNYDGRFRGPLRARVALAGSENVPAVQLLAKLGPPSLLRFLRANGFRNLTHTADYYGLGLTLGDAEVTLEQLVTGYATFARGGVPIAPRFLGSSGSSENSQHLFSPRTAWWITDILSDPKAREYAFGSGGSLDFPFPVAVKTGTSQAYRDNWTIGYTREVTVGVWVGNFDLQELRNSSGVTGAGPIFHDVMLAAVKRVGGGEGPIIERLDDLEQVPICALSGLRPSLACPNIESEWLPRDAPVTFCPLRHTQAQQTHLAGLEKPKRLIVNPPDGTTYLIDPTLRREFQALRLKATDHVAWSIDGKRVAADWPLRPGKHAVTAIASDGRRDEVWITVR